MDNPSAFHPKDIPYLVDRYQCDTQPFQYYDSKKRVWYTGTRFSAARDLKKLSPEDLCYRSQGVTSGEGMPCPSKKRPPPDDTHIWFPLLYYNTPLLWCKLYAYDGHIVFCYASGPLLFVTTRASCCLIWEH